jgi:Ner family transcriptional regulator
MVNKSPEQIKTMVYKAGGSLSRIDAINKLAPGACSHALYRPAERAEKAIAKFLKLKVQDIWPERWDSQGRRLRVPAVRNTHFRRSNLVAAKRSAA